MNRKKFIRNSLLAGSAAVAGSPAPGTAAGKYKPQKADKHTFKLNYAPHFGMFRHSGGDDLMDQLRFMADAGFGALEDNGMMSRSVDMQSKIGEALTRLDMQMGVFVIDKGGNGANSLAAGKPEHLDIFLDGCRRAVDVARRVNARWLTVVPGDFVRHLPIGIQTANVIEALRRGAEILEPHGLVMVLEPLSDTPDLFLRTSDQAYMICKAVGSPACKILYDIYHLQKNEGHLIRNIERCWEEIAYFQIGDNPGRNEPGTGEINYRNVFRHIHSRGYEGILGMEHGNALPGAPGEQALIRAYVEADSFEVS